MRGADPRRDGVEVDATFPKSLHIAVVRSLHQPPRVIHLPFPIRWIAVLHRPAGSGTSENARHDAVANLQPEAIQEVGEPTSAPDPRREATWVATPLSGLAMKAVGAAASCLTTQTGGSRRR
jgi:hypothetical protein